MPRIRRFTDHRFASGFGVPRPIDVELIVVHQTGNRKAGATAKMNLDHSHNTKSWSIHRIVDETGIYSAVPLDQCAWHVAEPRIARRQGIPTSIPGRSGRGDVASVGIEICVNNLLDRSGGQGEKTIPAGEDDYRAGADGWPSVHPSPSRNKQLDPKTYRAAIACLAELIAEFPDAKVVGHGQLDPWTRNTDPFGCCRTAGTPSCAPRNALRGSIAPSRLRRRGRPPLRRQASLDAKGSSCRLPAG